VYGDDYASVRGLQQLAGERQVAIAVIHHLRKAPASDPFDEINASNGLLASVDNAIVLRPVGGLYELHRRGRDYDTDDALALRGDAAHLTWTWAGTAEDALRSEQRKAIIAALREAAPDALSPRDLADLTGMSYGGVRFLLTKMAASDEVVRAGRGEYTVSPSTLHAVIPPNIAHSANNAAGTRNTSGAKGSQIVSANVSGSASANNAANNSPGREPGRQAASLSDVSAVSNVSGIAGVWEGLGNDELPVTGPVCVVCRQPKVWTGDGYTLTCDCGKGA
jgi:hypothetical protein